MLRDYNVHASLATRDAGASKRWYAEKLGFEPEVDEPGFLMYRVGDSTFSVYETPTAGTAKNTVAIWSVGDVKLEMGRLRQRGVTFEEYDFPEFKTENGLLATPDGFMTAWFKDADGNILQLMSTPGTERPTIISPMLAAVDMGRATSWYSQLGFEPDPAMSQDFQKVYRSGDATFVVYQSNFAGTARNTVAVWRVDDLRAEVAGLRERGVSLEDYDFGPDGRTTDGILAQSDGSLNAWFTDSEGNILGLAQVPRPA